MESNTSSRYRWPAEWERQTATWISWPHNRGTWPGHFDPIPGTFVQFIQALARVQKVEVLTGPAGISPSASACLVTNPNITLHSIPTNDVWIRDYGPTFVLERESGELVGIDWRFNAWGGKYPRYDSDAAAAEKVCQKIGCKRVPSRLTCEGGGMETDGLGTLLATSSCFVTDTRNPNWSRKEIESELSDKLGVEAILWIDGGGLEGDDTDGHIDQLARFVAPGKVVAAVSSRADDANAEGLQKNLRTLRQSRDARGELLEVIELPTPAPRLVDGKRVPESYCNFLLAEGIAIVPTFRSPSTDAHALKLLEQLMPGRIMVPLDAFDLIWGLGAFHCASQQQPASQRQPSPAS